MVSKGEMWVIRREVICTREEMRRSVWVPLAFCGELRLSVHLEWLCDSASQDYGVAGERNWLVKFRLERDGL